MDSYLKIRFFLILWLVHFVKFKWNNLLPFEKLKLGISKSIKVIKE